MTRFDSADDAERSIAFYIANVLHAVRAEAQSPNEAAPNVQAARVLASTVCSCPCDAYLTSDRLYGLAVMLADAVDHDAEGAPLAGTLRAWVKGVERQRK